MTLSTSDVAVCWSSDSAQFGRTCLDFIEKPGVLDGDHRLIGESPEDLNLFVGKRPNSDARQHDDTDRRPLTQEGNGKNRPVVAALLGLAESELRIGKDVRNVDNTAFEQCAPGNRTSIGQNRPGLNVVHECRRKLVIGGPIVLSVSGSHDAGHIGITEFRRKLGQRVENCMQIERRSADDLQDVGRCGLLLQQVTQFVEQPCIFDGNDGLVGKRRHQLDLLFRKWLGPGLSDEDNADDVVLTQKRNTECGTIAGDLLRSAPSVVGIGQDIRNMDRLASSAARPVTLPRSIGTSSGLK